MRLAVSALRKTLKTFDRNEEAGLIVDKGQREALVDLIAELESRGGKAPGTEVESLDLPFKRREDA
jgi:hypothetical protein